MNNFEAWTKLTWRHNAYIASFHENDRGGDDEWGNYLDGITIPGKTVPKLDGREGTKAMAHIAKNLYEYINITLNTEPVNYINEVNPNYLYENIGDNKQWVYYEQNGLKVPLDNVTFKDTNYNAFLDDETIFYKSNQKLLDDATDSMLGIFKNEYADIENTIMPLVKISPEQKVTIDASYTGAVSNAINTWASKIKIFDPVIKQNIVNDLINGMSKENFTKTFFAKSAAKFSLGFVADLAWKTFSFLLFDGSQKSPDQISDFFLQSSVVSLGTGLVSMALGPIAGFVTSFIIDTIMNIRVGNGHTIQENFGDHGLNDWEYQWDNNKDTMLSIEKEWSQNYTKGLNWKVVDGWFTYPHLYIQTNGDAGWTGVSKDVSSPMMSSTFNLGKKIEFLGKR